MFEENVNKFKTRLISRGYPKQKVDNIPSETKSGDRNEALNQKLGTHKKILRPFITQFQPSLPNLKNILKANHWHLI